MDIVSMMMKLMLLKKGYLGIYLDKVSKQTMVYHIEKLLMGEYEGILESQH